MPALVLVTPIWRERLSPTQTAFLRLTDAANRDTRRILLAPHDLEVSAYRTHFPEWEIRTCDPRHFASTRTYSHWLTDPAFYRAFAGAEFVVICQTDAVLMRPAAATLPVMQGYDLLGARWSPPLRVLTMGTRVSVSSDHERREGPAITRLIGRRLEVGNGGLTVRRTEALIRVTERIAARYPNRVREHIQEDVLICATGRRLGLRIVPPALASTLFQETELRDQHSMPDIVGCHGVERWNPSLAQQLAGRAEAS